MFLGGDGGRVSVLLPDDLRRSLPTLYETERSDNPTVHAKFFTPWTNWTWYVIEFDGEDLFFGLVEGHEVELGYFRLSELAEVVGPGGLGIERDEFFKPAPLREVKAAIERKGLGTPFFGSKLLKSLSSKGRGK